MHISDLYHSRTNDESDMKEFMPLLRCYAGSVKHITEFGVRRGYSTISFLAGYPDKLVSYDKTDCPDILDDLSNTELEASFQFIKGDSRQVEIEDTDLLFIDTTHTYKCLLSELLKHESRVSRFIIIHDTEVFGYIDHDYSKAEGYAPDENGTGPGLLKAILDFLKVHRQWRIKEHWRDASGLMVLSRVPVSVTLVKQTDGNGINTYHRLYLEA